MEKTKKQRGFILIVLPQVVGNAEVGNNQYNNLEELNKLMAEGWHYVSASPMSSADARYSVSLVILEKEDE